MLITSEQGLETVIDQNLTDKERKSLVRLRMSFGTWWFKPVKDKDGVLVGTTLFCCVSADAGGNIPKWIQNIAAPELAVQACVDITIAIKKSKVNQTNEQYKSLMDDSETNIAF